MEVGAGSTFDKGVVVKSGGVLLGAGTVSGAVAAESGGTITPGTSPGILTVNNNLTLQSGSTLVAELNGTAAGTQYDRLVVSGNVDVTGATLSLSLGYVPNSADKLFILVNTGANPITGTFAGLPQGERITLGEFFAHISYVGDSGGLTIDGGNDIVIHGFHPVLEPATVLLVAAAGLASLGAVRRLRRAAPTMAG